MSEVDVPFCEVVKKKEDRHDLPRSLLAEVQIGPDIHGVGPHWAVTGVTVTSDAPRRVVVGFSFDLTADQVMSFWEHCRSWYPGCDGGENE